MHKVVIVEDEELVRRGIVTAVNWASADCEVVGEAASGAEGIEVIRSSHPDIVVTDIRHAGHGRAGDDSQAPRGGLRG